jgi:hypothetical protein
VPARKIKVEFFDDAGTKHTITIEGNLTKEKINRVLDYVELMGRLQPTATSADRSYSNRKFERIRDILEEFRGRTFKSTEVQRAYEQRHGEQIPLSTVCTYLSRFADRGVVVRSGSPAEWLYTVKPQGTISWDSVFSR